MIKGTLSNGFNYELDETKLNDMRFLDMLAEMDNDPLIFPRLATFVLGKEQKQELYSLLADENGAVSVEAFADAITEMFEQVPELKN